MRWYLLRDGFLSYRAFLDRPKSLPASYRLLPEDRDRTTAFDREIPASFFAFDALRSFDLPQLLATSQAKGLIVNPRDGDRGRLPEEAARSLLPPRVRAVSAEEPGRRVGEFLHEVLGPGGRGGWTRSGTGSRGPSVVAPPPRWSGLTARRGARGGAGRDARAGRPVAGAGGQPEGEPGVGWGEDPRRLGEVPPTPPACPAGVARAALRRPRGPEGARHADAGRRRLPDREPRLREPAGAGGDRQPLSAGQSAAVDARHPDLSQPPQPQDPGRAAGHGHDLGPQRLPGAGHGPPRPRRAAAAPVPHRGRLSAPLPGRPAGLLLPPQHRRAAAPRRREPDGLDGLGPDARRGPAAVPPRHRQGPRHPPGCGRRRRRPGGRDGRPRPAGQGGRPVQLRRAAARLRRPRRPRPGFLLVRRPLLGVDPVPAAGGAGRVRPVADRRVRGPPAADLRPRVRLGPGARPGLAAAPEGLRLVRRPRPPGGRRGPRHPEGHAAGELPLQQHRPAPPQQDLPDPGALVRHADPRGVQHAAGAG